MCVESHKSKRSAVKQFLSRLKTSAQVLQSDRRQCIRFSGFSSRNGVFFHQWKEVEAGGGEIRQKTKLAAILSCFQDSHRDIQALQTQVSGPGGYLCYSVTLCLYARWLVRDVNPTHACQNATTLAGAGHAKSLSREKASLQPFSSNYKSSVAPEDSRPSKYGDYSAAPGGPRLRAELFIGMHCLLTVCVSIC